VSLERVSPAQCTLAEAITHRPLQIMLSHELT
jgi:hypothetical protein